MFEHPPIFYIITGIAAFIIGLAKGGLAGTLGTLATQLMALVIHPDQVVGLVLPMLMFTDVFAVAAHWRKWDRHLVLALLPGAVVGVTIGTYFITNAPTETLRKVLGAIVLLIAIYKLLENWAVKAAKYEGKTWHGVLAGTVAGFTSSLAHAGGPPIAIFLLLQDITPQVFVATSALFFALLNWVKVPYYAYSGLFNFSMLWDVVWLLPILPLGVWVGKWVSTRIDKVLFEKVITVLLAVTALLLIFG